MSATIESRGIKGGIEYFTVVYPSGEREEESQCARCGSSTAWADCWNCGGRGGYEDDGWDGQDEVWASCEECGGTGGRQHCISGPEWCEAHPRPGREHIESTALKPEAWND